MQKSPTIALLSGFAWLLAATAASATPLGLATLGSGTAPAPPLHKGTPFFLSAGQVVAGVQVVNVPRMQQSNSVGLYEYAFFTDPERARAYEVQLKNGTDTPFSRSETCFATTAAFSIPDAPLEWDTFAPDRLTLQTFPGDGAAKVVPVRAERWLEADGKVHVETTEFWADTRSGGTRLIARKDNELTRVASPFAGVSVYAFRSGPAAVSFFVRRDAPREAAAPILDPLPRLGVLRVGPSKSGVLDLRAFRTTVQGEVHSNECAFEHVELEIRPDTLPEPPVVEGTAKRLRLRQQPSLAKPAPPPPREIANIVFAAVLDLDSEPLQPPADDRERHTAHVRTMVLNLGLARSADAAPPVPSVSYRWLERARSVAF